MIKKIIVKRMRIEIDIQNKFYFWLKGEIEKKINWIKGFKKIKRIRIKIEIKNYRLKGKINSIKGQKSIIKK
jgi:hypothetical protein